MSYPKGCGWSIGKARVREIVDSLQKQGFVPRFRSIRGHGIDVLVEDRQGNLVMIMEVTNYNDINVLGSKKVESAKKILALYPFLKLPNSSLGIRRVLVVSFKQNYLASQFNGIATDVLVMDFQTVPKRLYDSHPELFEKYPKLMKEGRTTQLKTTWKLKELFQQYGIVP